MYSRWERELDSYGKSRQEVGDEGFCSQTYQGQVYDKDIGLTYNRFRWYNQEEGSYISQDPIGLAGGTALYAYVHDPNGWADVLGLACIEENKTQGATAEEKIYNDLLKNPNVVVLGRQVYIQTPGLGRGRYSDILIQNRKTGQIINVEVKSGRATRSSSQIEKDNLINSGGGVLARMPH